MQEIHKLHEFTLRCCYCKTPYMEERYLTRHYAMEPCSFEAERTLVARFPYACDNGECKYRSRTRNHLLHHKMMHLNRNAVCLKCGANFNTIKSLNKHLIFDHQEEVAYQDPDEEF